MSAMSGMESRPGLMPIGPEWVERSKNALLCSYYRNKSFSPCQTRTYERDFPGEFWSGELPEKELARVERYGKARRRSLEMVGYLDGVTESRKSMFRSAGRVYDYSSMRTCGSLLVFRHYYQVEDHWRLKYARFCRHHLLCASCALRRASRLLQSYLTPILTGGKGLEPFLVTHTVKNGASLGERVDHLSRSLSKVMYRGRRSRSGLLVGRASASCVVGAVGSVEVKRGSGSGLWHPHSHSLWLCDSNPEATLLRDEWAAVTGDSSVVNVSALSCGEIPAVLDKSKSDELVGELCEVFKYPLKFADLTLADNHAAALSLAGRRLIRSWGCLYGVKEDESMLDAPLSLLDEPYMDLMYRFWADGEYHLEASGDGC